MDERAIDSVSGKEVGAKNNFSTDADINLIKKITIEAKKRGIDPYTALAISMQETNLGKQKSGFQDIPEGNPLRMGADILDKNKDIMQQSMDFLKEKIDLAKRLGKKTDEDIIQAWNGYGKIHKYSEDVSDKYYGIDVSKTPIDMNKNPIYGKRVVDLRDNVIKKNPDLMKLIEETQ